MVSMRVWNVRRSRLLMPMIAAPARRATSSFRRGVHLHQRRQPEPLGRSLEIAAAARGSRMDAISRTASAPAARASQSWYSSSVKSLRSRGTATASRTASSKVEAPLEVLLVGEHRDGGGAVARIRGRQAHRVERRGQDPARGRGLLHLRQQLDPARGGLSAPAKSRGAGRWRQRDAQLAERNLGAAARDLQALVGDDGVEDRGQKSALSPRRRRVSRETSGS